MYGNRAPITAITEFDLREFLFDSLPRKLRLARSAALAALGSLERFFEFLAAEEGIECPWAAPILQDRSAFIERWETCPNKPFWDLESIDWISDLNADLQRRSLLPESDLGSGPESASVSDDLELPITPMTWEQHLVWLRLHRQWLAWRDEIIRSGVTDAETVYNRLAERARAQQST